MAILNKSVSRLRTGKASGRVKASLPAGPAVDFRARRAICTSVLAAVLIPVLTSVKMPEGATRPDSAAEYRVKAAFLFNFAKFVEWPAKTFKDEKESMTFCTVGEDPFRGTLDEVVSGKMIGPRSIRILHYQQPTDVHGCQVLFIGSEQKKNIASILDHLKYSAVLSVGESYGFAQQGGIIGFILEDDKLRFAINLDVARSEQLRISAKLLSLAKTVIVSPEGK